MRIITGEARGRRLKEPKGDQIRPTADQVKESMFNILRDCVEGRRVLDLFGGTGQLGLEAKSRGAAAVTILDQDRAALALIRENVRRTGLDVAVVQGEALSFLAHCGSYDLVLLDPPFHSSLAQESLDAIKRFDILSIGGIIVCETAGKTCLSPPAAPYRLLREYRYGKVKLTTFTKESQNYDNCDLSGQL